MRPQLCPESVVFLFLATDASSQPSDCSMASIKAEEEKEGDEKKTAELNTSTCCEPIEGVDKSATRDELEPLPNFESFKECLDYLAKVVIP